MQIDICEPQKFCRRKYATKYGSLCKNNSVVLDAKFHLNDIIVEQVVRVNRVFQAAAPYAPLSSVDR